MIAAKYKPTVQKDLFHKDVVNHIKKWIKIIERDNKNNLDVKRVLFIHGPIGSSKTVTVECLFKSYNLIDVDVNSLSPELLQCIVGFNEMTLSNVDKWNLKTNKEKSNIVLVDNRNVGKLFGRKRINFHKYRSRGIRSYFFCL